MSHTDRILGLHHVTAIGGAPQDNVDFYTRVLGLRLVKKTVNFDDPGTYHLYYGDEVGHPGTIITFFPWPGAYRGERGAGQLTVTSFSIPPTSIEYWAERLSFHGVEIAASVERFNEEVLTFSDPDGLMLELVTGKDDREPWHDGSVPVEHAIRGFHAVTLTEHALASTAALLTETMGLTLTGEERDRFRFETSGTDNASRVDVVAAPDAGSGRIAVGTVHHVAFRVADDAEQARWRDRLLDRGLDVSPVMDRQYFKSIYYREPGGVLFEIATDPPGFARDESVDTLGTQLQLPPWLEADRRRLERRLPEIRVT